MNNSGNSWTDLDEILYKIAAQMGRFPVNCPRPMAAKIAQKKKNSLSKIAISQRPISVKFGENTGIDVVINLFGKGLLKVTKKVNYLKTDLLRYVSVGVAYCLCHVQATDLRDQRGARSTDRSSLCAIG